MTSGPTYKEQNTLPDILQQLTELSKKMNEAIEQKDILKIEQIHLQKQALINKLNLLVVATGKEKRVSTK